MYIYIHIYIYIYTHTYNCIHHAYIYFFYKCNYIILRNQFQNILSLFDVLPNFLFTTNEAMCDYYL